MVSQVAVGEKITASKVNEIITDVNAVGLVQVIPTAVSGSGVSVDAVGRVSFTSATAVAVDGIFTSGFRNYKVSIDSSGTAATLVCVFRVSGVDVTTSNYDRTELLARNAGVTSSTTVAGASWTIIGFANTLIQASMDINTPQLAAPSTALALCGSHANPAVSNAANGFMQTYLTHRLSTSYDGMKWTFSAAQTGTLRVYGYN
jgi:hypothetical protein